MASQSDLCQFTDIETKKCKRSCMPTANKQPPDRPNWEDRQLFGVCTGMPMRWTDDDISTRIGEALPHFACDGRSVEMRPHHRATVQDEPLAMNERGQTKGEAQKVKCFHSRCLTDRA